MWKSRLAQRRQLDRAREEPVVEEATREERLSRNQAVFRAINERMRELNEAFDDLVPTHTYACECANLSCLEQIEVPPGDYEAVRRHSRRFFVAPSDSHVIPDIERIVVKAPQYWIVEKFTAPPPLDN
jgi:hypothetical protein